MKLTTLTISIHKEDECPINGLQVTKVSADNYGAGFFFTISQDEGSIQLDAEELDYVIRAVNILKAELGE
jgi:hypothetical protein